MHLSEVQRKHFLRFINHYLEWNQTREGQKNMEDHREHQRYFQERMSKKAIQDMDLAKFKGVYKALWASKTWGNKDWYVENRLLKPNKDLEFIKGHLIKLFYQSELPLAQRYNDFKRNIKGLGSSALTELFHFIFPDKYCLWNEKPKTVLPFLNLDSLLPERIFRYQFTDGDEYFKCNEVMDLLRKELVRAGLTNADFIDLDCYIWFIFIKKLPKQKRGGIRKAGTRTKVKKKEKVSTIIKSHEDAEFYLLRLGETLGYITYTSDRKVISHDVRLGEIAIAKQLPPFAGLRDMNSARKIDVVWFDEDENPRYCFEVEHSMDILRSLNRLYQLRHFHVRFFIVSPDARRAKFETERSKAPFRGEKNRFHFISYDELISLYESANTFFQLRNALLEE